MTQIDIRRLGQGDGALLARVAEAVFDGPISAARLAAYLAAPGHHMVVALANGEVVGQCAAVVHRHPDKPTELYIDEVGVADGYRQRGIATRMLDAMFDIGRQEGCDEAWVGTEPDNVPARALYQSRDERGDPAQAFVMYVYYL